MAKFDHAYIQEVAELNLPHPDRIMITHGSALVVRGIRPERVGGDIDLVGSQDNLHYLRHVLGWQAIRQNKYYDEDLPSKVRSTISPDGRFDVFAHDFVPEMYINSLPHRGRVYPNRLFELHNSRFDQDEATGIWVASAMFVAATKRGTGRLKDEDDIRRIEQYLQDGF